MPLGFARDSVLDLASMVKHDESTNNNDDTTNLVTTQKEGETSEVSLAIELDDDDNNNDNDNTNNNNNSVSAEEENDDSMSEEPQRTQYAGFQGHDSNHSTDDEMSYQVDPYAPTIFTHHTGPSQLWCCLMPWAKPITMQDSEQHVQLAEDKSAPSLSLSRTRVKQNTKETHYSTNTSNNTNINGATTVTNGQSPETTTSNTLETTNQRRGTRGILKRGSIIQTIPQSLQMNGMLTDGTQRRRSLFPHYEDSKSTPMEQRIRHHVSFSPMARVVTVKSRADMTFMEKSAVWWQKQDYEDFKKTGRIIAKAMLEGGFEVWLATNKSWQLKQLAKTATGTSAQLPRAYHLTERTHIDRSQNPGQVSSEGNKWWNQFGHSRRGLEHIASVDEGRQRQGNVRTAIRMVIDEQRRQKIYRKEDPEKLRTVSLQHTAWARDLSLAAAESDTEAVRSNFSEQARTREYYMLRFSLANANATYARQIPAFMTHIGVSPLDAHTSSQIRFRRKMTESPLVKTRHVEHSMVDDTTMAKQAAGYGVAETDMSKVLSGMGVAAETLPAQTSVGAH
jgi:hypothetical protein